MTVGAPTERSETHDACTATSRWPPPVAHAEQREIVLEYADVLDGYEPALRTSVTRCLGAIGKPFADLAVANPGLTVLIVRCAEQLAVQGQDPRPWLRRVLTTRRPQALAEVGWPASRSVERILRRIEPHVPSDVLDQLHRTVSSPQGIPQVLQHLPRITAEQVELVCDPELRVFVRDSFVRDLPAMTPMSHHGIVFEVRRYAAMARRYATELEKAGIRLKPAGSYDELKRNTVRLADLHLAVCNARLLKENCHLGIPLVPPTRDGVIRYLPRPRDLLDAGRRFGNCLQRELAEYLWHGVAVYELLAPEPGLIAIGPDGSGKVEILEAAGPGNCDLTFEAEHLIGDWFSTGLRRPDLPVRVESWLPCASPALWRLLRSTGVQWRAVAFMEEIAPYLREAGLCTENWAENLRSGVFVGLVPDDAPGSVAVLTDVGRDEWRVHRVLGQPLPPARLRALCECINVEGRPCHSKTELFHAVSLGPEQPSDWLPLHFHPGSVRPPGLDTDGCRGLDINQFVTIAGPEYFPVRQWLPPVLAGGAVPVLVEDGMDKGVFMLVRHGQGWWVAASVSVDGAPTGAPAPARLWCKVCEILGKAGVASEDRDTCATQPETRVPAKELQSWFPWAW